MPVTSGGTAQSAMLGAGHDLDWYGHLVDLEYPAMPAASSQTQTVGPKIGTRV